MREEASPVWERLRSQVEGARGRLVQIDVSSIDHPDCATVDTLARLQLLARRHGRAIALRNASSELCELLELCGLTDVIPLIEGP